MKFEPIPGVAVLGLGHKARQGKDTAAAAIVAGIPGAMRFSFADDLYAVCRVMHGMTTKDSVLLQRIGVEAREKDEHVWVRAVYSKILDARPRLAVITDVRFPNEFDFVKALGGRLVRVERYRGSWAGVNRYVDPSRPAEHTSEVALDDAPWDETLFNYENRMDWFQEAAVRLAGTLLPPPHCSARYKDHASGGLLRCRKDAGHDGAHLSEGGSVALSWPNAPVVPDFAESVCCGNPRTCPDPCADGRNE